MTERLDTERPANLIDLKQWVVANRLTLPTQQELVARAVLTRPDVVAFGTTASVARLCSVSPSTVLRVSTALGFGGFREFRNFFRQHLRMNAKKNTPGLSKN
ncbi:MurR/RpiR family transcriptional regulator [Rhizobium leguminosarum]|uniref:MurR/RpiR family transcriptional regulator n=1 Tax=Rhizobium leguminosarum TaxID=384 RepID=UPI0009B7D9DE|nr:MurR/RpiR family transcriptional regulator [Rhizobium leguminosarum]MBY5318586.1 MurR/RpiR family transcriptional regulator [Rhizobium leguminosarum]MBY5325714.1 MurR/RpiR family transcriptional regulator [Rhizobium leguminosarum]